MKIQVFVLLVCLAFWGTVTQKASALEPASNESIQTLMDKTGAGELGMQMMNQMLPVLQQMIPDAPVAFWDSVLAEADAQQIIELTIPVYQKHLSQSDVDGINAFYETEAGKNLIQAQPLIMQESMALGQKWGEELAQRVIQKYQAEHQ